MATPQTIERRKPIDDDVLEVLAGIEWEDGIARLTGQLDRKLYLKTNKVLEALGGKWNRKIKGHVFDGDGETAVRDSVLLGVYVDAKTDYQFFETPERLAAKLCIAAGVKSGMRVLEPSAGKGAIAKESHARGAEVWCVEINDECIVVLSELEAVHKVITSDFIEQQPDDLGLFDAVVMNPPFTRQQDIKHVRHAFEFLKPGGRLAAIMSPGFTFRSDRASREFLAWSNDAGATWVANPVGSFKESGTMVSTITFTSTR